MPYTFWLGIFSLMEIFLGIGTILRRVVLHLWATVNPNPNPLFIRGSGNRTTLSQLSFDESGDQCYDSDQGDWALGSAQWAPYEGAMLFCTWDWTSLIFRSHSQAGSASWHVAQGGHLVLFVKLKTFKFGKKNSSLSLWFVMSPSENADRSKKRVQDAAIEGFNTDQSSQPANMKNIAQLLFSKAVQWLYSVVQCSQWRENTCLSK